MCIRLILETILLQNIYCSPFKQLCLTEASFAKNGTAENLIASLTHGTFQEQWPLETRDTPDETLLMKPCCIAT